MAENIDETSLKIMKATLVVLQREGSKATTKKIAAESGFNELTIFRKFKNKNNLINATKEYYLKLLMDKLEDAFDYGEDEDIEEFLRITFFGILNLEESDFDILRLAMEEVRESSDNKSIMLEVALFIIEKLEGFFKIQIEKGIVKDIDIRSIAVMCFNSIFQSVLLWKIYSIDVGFDTNHYVDNLLNMLLEGIGVQK